MVTTKHILWKKNLLLSKDESNRLSGKPTAFISPNTLDFPTKECCLVKTNWS